MDVEEVGDLDVPGDADVEGDRGVGGQQVGGVLHEGVLRVGVYVGVGGTLQRYH